MKSFIKTLSIALSSTFLSIFIYDIYFNSASTENSDNSPKPKLIPTNYTYTYRNAGAELTDFTIAAEKTVHAVVHVKNTSSSGKLNRLISIVTFMGMMTSQNELEQDRV